MPMRMERATRNGWRLKAGSSATLTVSATSDPVKIEKLR
jgi:hypothetical protein